MKNTSFTRYWMIGGTLTAAALFIFIWMIQIQTSSTAKEIKAEGEAYKMVTSTIYPERGNIYDRWGHLLAGNVEAYEIGVDLRYVNDPTTIAANISTVLGDEVKYSDIYDRVNQKWETDAPKYVRLAAFISADKIEQLRVIITQLDDQAAAAAKKHRKDPMPNMDGVIFTPRMVRSYPEHSLASNILGFYGYREEEKARGYYGVEEKYNQLLAGTPITVKVPNDPYLITKTPSVDPGASLVLTIDRDVQAMVERIADESLTKTGAQSATIIVMDPKTGEIMAMASTPRMDPNEYWKYGQVFSSSTPFNRGIGQTYEPGSVFKVLTMAAALDAKAVEPSTSFLDTGTILVGGVAIHNWDRGAWGPQDMTGCMQHSLNVCLSWIATQLGPTRFYTYMKSFGIGHLTGIDMAGEASYPMRVQSDPGWYEVNLATNSFGQGIATTPLQMISAVASVANNGKMMAPHVLKSVIQNGEEFANPPQVIGTPISSQTARTLTDMLAISLEKESSSALVEGYRLAGKTGTAEIPGPDGYTSSQTNASFVGWGPADDPRFVVYVWLEKPSASVWGSVVAAPVFSEVVKNLVVLMDLPPDSVRQQIAKQ